jgi:hypothetical protein
MLASLSAVRAAQADAVARNRRETWKARLVVGTAVATFAVGMVATRARAGRKAPPRANAAVAAAVASPEPLAPEPPAPAPATAAALVAPMPTGPALAAPIVAAPPISDEARATAIAECEQLSRQHHWRQAAEPCALAAKARPDDPSIVMGMAQSEHARNRMAEAGQWAGRAIALDANLAEAYVIRAHAERRAGDPAAAARDFRKYLELAPRGWHAREARAAVR